MKHLVVLHFLFIKEENLSKRGTFFCLLHKRGILWTRMRILVSKGFHWHKTAMEKCFAELLTPILKSQCSSKQLGKRLRSLITHPSAAKHPQNPVLIYWLSTRIEHISCIEVNFGLYGFMNTHVKCTGAENKWWLSPKMLYFLNVFDLKFSKRSKILKALWGKKRVGQRKLSSICVFAYC